MDVFRRPNISDKQKAEMFKEASKPIVCKSQQDIMNILREFLSKPDNKEIPIEVNMDWSDKEGKGTDKIQGVSRDTSLYSVLLQGLEIVRERIRVNRGIADAIKAAEEEGDTVPASNFFMDINELRFRVDELIERRLGGKRFEDKVRWDVSDGVFEFDPFTKKFYKL